MIEDATLLILSGGESRRMGYPKHRIHVGGRTIIKHIQTSLDQLFAELLLVGYDLPRKPKGIRFVADIHSIKCPLGGIYSGLRASRTNLCFVVACDMPYIVPNLVDLVLRRTAGADVAVPIARGFFEPLCAAYRRSTLPTIERALRDQRLKVSALYRDLRTNVVAEDEVRSVDPHLLSFRNVNTPCDMATYGTAELGLTVRS